MMSGRVSDEPGISIIILSLFVDFLALPLYMRADAIQAEDAVLLERWEYLLYELPVIGWLYRLAVHTWMTAGCLALLLWKMGREVLAILPGIVVLLICVMPPLNGSVRYYLPVMAAIPVYLGVCMTACKEKGHSNKKRNTKIYEEAVL